METPDVTKNDYETSNQLSVCSRIFHPALPPCTSLSKVRSKTGDSMLG